MCGIFCSLSSRATVEPSHAALERLRCRGPDSECELRVQLGSPPCNVLLCSTVLSLRGSHVTTQPYTGADDDFVLCWNGEAWSIDGESGLENDTASVHGLLRHALNQGSGTLREGREAVSSGLSRVAGPYAFVLLDRRRAHLYLGRDFLGRRSLCWSRTSRGDLIFCSTPDTSSSNTWREVEADGIYGVDLKDYCASTSGIAQDDANDRFPASLCVPYRWIDEGSSVLPRLSLNKTLPSSPTHLDETSPAVGRLCGLLRQSLSLRILNVPDSPAAKKPTDPAKLAILFSGGLDCTVLARLSHDLLPPSDAIDLVNVAFENPRIHAKLEGGSDAAYELCPDRITGRASLLELQSVCPGRTFRFVAMNIPYSETLQHREMVISLMHPHNTEMDLSIAYALYFAARGVDLVTDSASGDSSTYETPSRVLLSGLGADELFGGYTRHATAFRRAGFPGLIDELELDVSRLGKRNLGRDDRVISHWGREARFPFLDEALLAWALNAPVTDKCGFGEESAGDQVTATSLEPGKKVLRCLAWKLGMTGVAKEKKRAVKHSRGTPLDGKALLTAAAAPDPIRRSHCQDGNGKDEGHNAAVLMSFTRVFAPTWAGKPAAW